MWPRVWPGTSITSNSSAGAPMRTRSPPATRRVMCSIASCAGPNTAIGSPSRAREQLGHSADVVAVVVRE